MHFGEEIFAIFYRVRIDIHFGVVFQTRHRFYAGAVGNQAKFYFVLKFLFFDLFVDLVDRLFGAINVRPH